MKKTKLIGLAALMLALGVVGCGDQPGDDPGDNPGEQECSHDWSDWKSDATKHWKECTKCGEKKSEKDHSYSSVAKDQTGVTRATCIAAGQVKKACTCGAETIVAEDATGHTMQELGAEAEGYVAANCSQAGTMPRKCKDCEVTDTVEIPVTDHNYVAVEEADAAIVATSGKVAKAATCEADGVDLTICHGCNDVKENVVAKLGHSMVTTDTAEPAAGKAAVRIYTCQNGCGKSELGFKASEASAESLPHLVIDAETGGARFWGRPIGNDVTLNESGDPSQDSHEAVFNAEQPGDFFEYVFDLTKDQADKLANCRLYCEATAAQWMSNNGMDFWACKSGDTDWTRGMYVETTATHEAGTEIDNYRYILYVDDVVQDFDPTISVPAQSNSVKTEYVLPFTFHLHEGTNKIRLVMAGGYRSTFFNFIFRAIEEEQGQDQPGGDDPAQTPVKVTANTETLQSGDVEISWSGKDVATTQSQNVDLTNNDFMKFSASANGSATTAPTADKRSFVIFYVDSAKASANTKLSFEALRNKSNITQSWFGKESGDQSYTYVEDPDNAGAYIPSPYRYEVKVNDVVVPFTGRGATMSKTKGWVDFVLENFALNAGTNKIEISALGGYSVEIYNWKLTLHEHALSLSDTKKNADNKDVKLEACSGGDLKRISIAFTDGTVTDGSISSGKMAKGATSTWKVNVDKDIKGAKLFFATKCSSADHENRHLYNEYFYDLAHDGEEGYVKQNTGGTPDKSTEDEWRYTVTVNGTNAPISNMKTVKENGISNGETGYMEFAVIDLVAGENTIALKQNNIGYRWVFQNDVRIEFVGDAVIADVVIPE